MVACEGAGVSPAGLTGSLSAVHSNIPGAVGTCIFVGTTTRSGTKATSQLDPDNVRRAMVFLRDVMPVVDK